MPALHEESRFNIQPLAQKHKRADFACGVEALDIYLRTQAGQDRRKNAAVTFVATSDGVAIAGYYTLSRYAIELGNIPDSAARKLPRYPMVPTTLLGRLAVSNAARGQRLGELLLMDALRRSLELSRQIASAGAVVDPRDESAARFYRKYGFLELAGGTRLFLSMGTIHKLFT